MDYIHIGAIGFAQLAMPNYYEKRRIEKQIIRELLEREKAFIIPKEFQHMCYLTIKKFPYEYDSYDELVLMYSETVLNDWENEDVDLLTTKADSFWEFANGLERYDLETEELMERCQALFHKSYPMLVVHKKNNEEDDNNLMAV